MARFRRGFLAFLIAVLTLPAWGYGNDRGRVLCFGDDGHVAVEAGLNGVCGSGAGGSALSGRHGDRNGFVASLAVSHCGPCTDYPYLVDKGDLFVPSHKIHGASAAPFPGGAPATSVLPPARRTLAFLSRPAYPVDRPDPTCAALRTTILLT
jgi:hypothetical protein